MVASPGIRTIDPYQGNPLRSIPNIAARPSRPFSGSAAGWSKAMYVQFTAPGYGEALDRSGSVSGAAGGLAHSGGLDALVALERIGTRRLCARNEAIFSEGDAADCWFKVVSGAVRICK